jgi:putative ATP-dependent endonuclease of the OLD family
VAWRGAAARRLDPREESSWSMLVLRLEVRHFRGSAHAVVLPRGHALVVGESRAGRSDLLAALKRLLDPDATKAALEEWDFHGRDLARDIEIEVVLGELGPDLRQRFLGELEFWDPERELVLAGSDTTQQLAAAGATPVLRLAYRGRWNHTEEAGEHWVAFAKSSDPDADQFKRVPRADRAALPFLAPTLGRPLALTAQGPFRRLLEQRGPDDIAQALRDMAAGVEELSAKLSAAPAVVEGLEAVLAPVRRALGLPAPAGDAVRFLPEGGSVTGLLRALQPVVDLADGAGFLPLRRHGSTTAALLGAAEVLVAVGHAEAVIALDDFADALDVASAERLAGLLRAGVGQLWLSTRRPETARSFAPDELIRLSLAGGHRSVHQARTPTSDSERLAARHLHRQLLPAMTARAVVVCEGTHDSAGLGALADRLDREQGVAPPCAYGVRLLDAGGIDGVPRLCELARSLGFRVVAAIDRDRDDAEAARRPAAIAQHAHGVVRLPRGAAIERALVDGVPRADLLAVLRNLEAVYTLQLPTDLEARPDQAVHDLAVKRLHKRSLHAEFLAALPASSLPALGIRLLATMLELARGTRSGMVDL